MRKCLEEIRGWAKKGVGLSEWKEERKSFFEEKLIIKEIEESRDKGEFKWEEVEELDRESQEEDGGK